MAHQICIVRFSFESTSHKINYVSDYRYHITQQRFKMKTYAELKAEKEAIEKQMAAAKKSGRSEALKNVKSTVQRV